MAQRRTKEKSQSQSIRKKKIGNMMEIFEAQGEIKNKANVLYSNHVCAFYSLHWNLVCICLNGRISSRMWTHINYVNNVCSRYTGCLKSAEYYFCRLCDAFIDVYFSSFIPNDQYTACPSCQTLLIIVATFLPSTTVYIINISISNGNMAKRS